MSSVYFKTMGCSANFAESEIMAGLLAEKDFKIAEKAEDSDIIILNACTVKGEITALKEMRNLKKNPGKKKFIIAGCITKKLIDEVEKIDNKACFLNTHNIERIVEVANNALKGKKAEVLDKKNRIKVCLPKIHKNKIINIVPIASGCSSFCTYCSTKLVKGNIFSYPKSMIIKEVEKSVKEGCKEIWLTSQDNADYGLDKEKKSQLPKLIQEVSRIKGDFKVRIGMMNPNTILSVLGELIEAFKPKKIFRFVHVPVQSGNDNILGKMARKYKIRDFKKIIREFRKEIPGITISTDVILGFPAETEKEFNDTVKLVKEIKPDVLNISRYIAREGTLAFKFKQHPDRIKKDCSRLMTKVFQKISEEKNKKWLGWQGEILIDEFGKNSTFVGRNYAYKPVIVKGKFKLGDKIKVKIKETTIYDLRATTTHPAP